MPVLLRVMLPLACLSLLGSTTSLADDDKSKSTKSTGTMTFLGTVKGEIVKVSDGGNKITVKYKEMVATLQTSSSGAMTRVGGSSSRFRPPSTREWGLKEKNQDLEVRLLDKPIIRLLSSRELPGEDKGKPRKKEGDSANKESDKETDDDANMKAKSKSSKTTGKPAENNLPGKPGDPGSLAKGQVVVLNVIREDLPGFSRLVTGTIYILGEK